MTTGNRSGFPARRKWAAMLPVIVLGLVAAGYGFYRVEAKHIRLDKYNELATIGELKAGQIAQWRLERLGDILEDAESPFFAKAVETWLKDSGNLALRDEFRQRLKLEQRAENYTDALLLDPDGRILLAAKDDPGPVDAATMKAVAQALEGKQAALSELFRSPDGHVCIDAVAPVFDANNQPVAFVVLRSDAAEFLYPLIQSWPIPSRSAETLLVRKEGDDVLFLNELRHQAGAALSFRTPLARRDLPGAQAVAGKQGMFEGRDYRGVEVLADLRPVPGSPWFMVAKVDASEIMAEPHSLGEVVAIFVVLSIFLATAVVAFLYRERQVRLYRVLHASERETRQAQELLRESEERYRLLFGAIDEGFCIIEVIFDEHEKPTDYRFLETNPSFEKQTGLIDAQGKRMRELAPKHEEHWFEIYGKIAVTGQPARFVNRAEQLHRWYDVYAFRFGQPENRQVAILFNDITERKRTEDELRKSEARFRRYFDLPLHGIAITSPGKGWMEANSRICSILGYTRDELARITWADITHPDDLAADVEQFNRLLSGEIEQYTTDKRFIRKDGGVAWTSIAVGCVRQSDGNVDYVVAYMEDITERKRTEEGLRVALIKYKTLFDCFPLGITVSDEVGNILETNPAAEKLLGMRQEEHVRRAIDSPDWRIVRPDGTPMPSDEYASVRALREKRAVENVEMGIVKPDNTITWINVTAAPLPLEGYGVAVTYGDITERKRAEEALRESEERFRTLFNRIPDGVYRSTHAGRFLDVNPAMVKMFGYDSREEMLAADIPRDLYFSPEDREWQILPTGQEEIDVIRQRRKDGSEIWVEVHGHYVRDGQGNILFHEGIVRDVTERKRAEEALRESEERYRILFDRANDGIFLLSVDGELISVNESFARMHGYSAKEMLHMSLRDLDTPATARLIPERMRRVLAGQALTFEVEHYHKDGHIVPLEVSASLISFGEKSFVQCFHRDITECKRAEEALRKMSSLLSRAQDEEDRRIARELHDSTGQKLAALSMTVGLLYDTAGAPDGKTEKMFTDCLAMIDQCAHEIRTLSYLLHPPLLDELGLAAAISDYIEGFSKRSGLQVALDVPPDLERLPGEVEIALFHVVQESLGNIHRHAGATTVRIRLACDAEQVTLEVSDQGRGISPETMRAIEEGGGSAGVGIAGMRERLRLLGGRLEIKSGGQGATVRAIVPIAECGSGIAERGLGM